MKSSITFLICSLFNFYSFGQTFGNDETFNPNDTAFYFSENQYLRIALQPDGKTIVAETYPNKRIFRWNQDAHVDHTFSTKSWLNDSTRIDDILALPDGKLLVAGYFINGNKSSLIRLLSNGKIDNIFNISFPNLTHKKILLQPDGKIILMGSYGLIRLNPDGGIDNTFNPNNGVGFNETPNAIALQPDGKILVGGGYFTSYNGNSYKSLMRFNADGSIDNTLNIGTGFTIPQQIPTTLPAMVYSIAAQSDGKILVGGRFSSYNGVGQIFSLVRLNPNGSLDDSFSLGTSLLSEVYTISCQIDNKILVGCNTYNLKGIVRLNADGSIDNSFNNSSPKIQTKQAIIDTNGDILVLGTSITYSRYNSSKVLKLKSNGDIYQVFEIGTGFDFFVQTMDLQPDGKILVGGWFGKYYSAQELSGNYMSRLHSDGTKDTTFRVGIGFDNIVYTIKLQPDGKILVGGIFRSYQGVSCNKLVRLNSDGSLDNSFNIGSSFNDYEFNKIVIQPEGKILVSCYTNGIGKVLRFNQDGSLDNSFSTKFSSRVNTMFLQPDGKILVGGDFNKFQDMPSKQLIRLNSDGSIDNAFDLGVNIDRGITATALQPDGKIIISGHILYKKTLSSESTIMRLVRLNSNGGQDDTFKPDSIFNQIQTSLSNITIQPDYKILITGGYFNIVKNQSMGLVVRLHPHGELDNTFGTGIGFNGIPNAIALQPDEKILLGGGFTTYNDKFIRNRIARLNPYSGDGVLYPLAINNIYQSLLSIYPNPTSDYINLQANFGSIWQITDAFGRVVMAGKIEKPNIQLDMRKLPQGIYILCLTGPTRE
ncbi:MAG: T9SS type A sorting domain-containing protein [Raineya sp.]|nr:T9SS type A sorting domain-containing protein [Raineya sp.]